MTDETLLKDLRNTRDVVNMVAQRHKQIKEQLAATLLHFNLHCATSFEGPSTANDESKIVCSKLRVIIGCISVRVAGRRQNCAALNARFCSQYC
jgi:hypothetical protein